MKNYLTLLLTVICIYTGQSQNIEGDILVCTQTCEEYSIEDGLGGPYLWSTDIGRMDSNQGEKVAICWETAGDGIVSVLDLSGSSGSQKTNLNVEVVSPPIADVYFPDFPICTSLDSLMEENPNTDFTIFKCQTVCAGSTVHYFVPGITQDSNYVRWMVDGGAVSYDPNEEEGNSISVTWGEGGFGSITVEVSNIAGCSDAETFCIEILDNPDVTITSNQSGSLCIGQDVTLSAESDNAVDFYWSIDDVSYGDQSQAHFSFDSGGTYNVELITNTECMCADTLNYIIEVIDTPGPEIDCISTAHINIPQTYFATDECDSYNWTVGPQGTIIEGGGANDNFVVVEWTDGPYGEISLNSMGCDNVVCPQTTTEFVPVIIPNLEIAGPDIVCNDGKSIYSLPLYPGTIYNWSLTGNGQIIEGFGTNEIVVQWNSIAYLPQNATLTVNYENCLLECTGTATKDITSKFRFEISGSEKSICVGDQLQFFSIAGYSSVLGDWELFDNDGVLLDSEVGATSWRVDATYDPGFYVVKLSDQTGDYCNESAVTNFQILERPESITAIDGPLTVCKNEKYVYTPASAVEGSALLNWTFNDGGTTTTIEGRSAVYTWVSDGPYSISVEVEDDRSCVSEQYTISLESVLSAIIEGDSNLCLHDTGTYEVDNNSTDITWTVNPLGAGTVYENADGVAEITWHEIGSHTVSVDFCGANLSYNVDVLSPPEFTLDYDRELCAGESTSVNVMTTATVSSVEILDEDDNVVGSGTDIGPGYFYVELTDVTGCSARQQIGIDTIAPPVVSLTTPDFEYFCQPATDRVLHAPDSEEGYMYEWFRDGVTLGNNNPTYSTSDYGEYQVEVTDIRGCKTLSNSLNLIESCATDTIFNNTPCNSVDTVGFTFDNTPFCNEFQFTNVSSAGHDPTSIRYQFYDPVVGFTTFSTEENPLHIFPAPGYYKVVMRGDVPDMDNPGSTCSDYFLDIVEVPIAASFHVIKNCVNEPMEFRNTSTFLPGKNIVSYEWDFGDPASGAANISTDAEATHTYTSTGTYLVKLTIESDDGCLSRVIEEITVFPDADVDFVLPRNLCAGEALKFVTPAGSNLSDFIWTFDDPNATAAQNIVESETAIHFFSVSGTYDVTLEANNIFGCSSSITKSITVDNNSLTGSIVASTNDPICEGESVTLTAPTGIAYIWSTGETTESIEAFNQGNYGVTVTGSDACNFVPEKVLVEVIPKPQFEVIGYTYPEGYVYDGFPNFGALELCKGERFDLGTRWQNNWAYSWNILGATGRYINYGTLSALASGTYDIVVTVSDPSSGCSFDSDPFILTINDLPDVVNIVSDQTDFCEGKDFVFTVSNPLPNMTYYWNNGHIGESMTTSQAGNYFATAVNEFGCARQSNFLSIDALPNVDLLPQGCQEVCFPFELCLPNLGYSYELLLNGVSLGSPSFNTTYTVNEAGDYQFVASSFQGCTNTSEVLTLYPEALNHSVSGVVYLDENQNQLFDGSDMLLENALVYLRIGNVKIDSLLSDINGAYSFTGIDSRNVVIEINAESVPDDVPAEQLLAFVEFEECEDDEVIDFPLNTDCSPTNELLDLYVCAGQDAEYEGNFYPPGFTAPFTYQSVNGCDSTVVLTVIESVQPNISVTSDLSCYGQDNGTLTIDPATNPNFLFTLDNSIPFSTQLIFDNLSPGNYDLFILDDNGCEYVLPQVVTESAEIVVSLDLVEACEGSDNGILNIIVDPTFNYEYSLDGSAFTTDLQYNNLASGSHLLIVLDADGCEVQYPFDIIEKSGFQITLDPTETCTNADMGSVEIISSQSSGLTMVLDNGAMVTDQFVFDNLSAGSHTLLIDDGLGCAQELTFVIENEATPLLSYDLTKTCSGVASGQIDIDDLGSGFLYTIDNGTLSTDRIFSDLAEGNYDIQVQSQLGCIYDFNATIESHPEITAEIMAEESCPGMSNGIILLEDIDNDLLLSIDGINYVTEDIIGDLDVNMYQVYVKDANDCVSELSLTVGEAAPLELSFEDYVTDCGTESLILEPTLISSAGDVEYTWNTGDDMSSISIDESNVYSVEISDECSSEFYEWDIEFIETEFAKVYMPNILNPEAADPVNKSFKPLFGSNVTVGDFNMKIYDRWGNIICDSDDVTEGWDGFINGTKADNGVYLWSYEMDVEECGETRTIRQAGDITLIK